MTFRAFTLAAALAAALALTLAAPDVRAQDPAADWPSKPIRIVVGFTPGGGPDITARFLAPRLAEIFKQPVTVENRPGAGGTVAAGQVARATPDGYTLLSVSTAHAIAAAINATLPYDTFRDLAPITETASSKYVLVVPPDSPVKTVPELLALAKQKPGALNFSSAGTGSGTHFATEIFKAMAGIDVVHVPNKGIPEALTEVLGGRVQFFFAPISNAVAPVRERKVLALGVSSLERDPLLPDVPSIAEVAVPKYETDLWFGLLTAAAVPKPVIAKLNREITRILEEPATKERWAPIGLQARPGPPEQFDRKIRRDVETFTRIARSAGIRAE